MLSQNSIPTRTRPTIDLFTGTHQLITELQERLSLGESFDNPSGGGESNGEMPLRIGRRRLPSRNNDPYGRDTDLLIINHVTFQLSLLIESDR